MSNVREAAREVGRIRLFLKDLFSNGENNKVDNGVKLSPELEEAIKKADSLAEEFDRFDEKNPRVKPTSKGFKGFKGEEVKKYSKAQGNRRKAEKGNEIEF